MFGKILADIADTAASVVKVAALPVALAASVAREVTKPIGDAAQDAAKAVSDDIKDACS